MITGEISHFLHKVVLSLKLVSCGTQDTRAIVTRHQIRGSSAYLLALYSINMYCKQGLTCDRLLTCSLCCYELSGFHTEGKEHWDSPTIPLSRNLKIMKGGGMIDLFYPLCLCYTGRKKCMYGYILFYILSCHIRGLMPLYSVMLLHL